MRTITLGKMLVALLWLATHVAAADDPAALTGEWKLVKIGDKAVPATVMATLRVTAEGKVSGNTGVNLYSGHLAKEKKLFGPLILTRRAGPPAAMEVESGLTKALDEATRFTVKDKTLTLLAGDTARLEFAKE